MTNAYIDVAKNGAHVAAEVRRAVPLAGGRITTNPARAAIRIVCADSCKNAKAVDSITPRLLVGRGTVRDRRAACSYGFKEVIEPLLPVLVPRLRHWFDVTRASVDFTPTSDGIEIGGVLVSLSPAEHALVRALHEANGARRSRAWLLENVWDLDPTLETQTVGSTAYKTNKKIAPFGVRIHGNKRGWCISRGKP